MSDTFLNRKVRPKISDNSLNKRVRPKISIVFINWIDGNGRADGKNNVMFNILRPHFQLAINSANPAYIFFCHRGDEYRKYVRAIKIFYSGENLTHGDLPTRYKLAKYTITYLPDSSKNFMLKNYERLYGFDCYQPFLRGEITTTMFDELIAKKQKFCCFIVSNGKCPMRNLFFRTLSKYRPVDSCGRFMRNISRSIVVPSRASPAYFNFIRQYKFIISFENSSTPHYLTEKIYDGFRANTIPIYWGDPKVGEVFRESAFLRVRGKPAQNNMAQVIQEIIDLDTDPTKYREKLTQTLSPVCESYLAKFAGRREEFIKFAGRIFASSPNQKT